MPPFPNEQEALPTVLLRCLAFIYLFNYFKAFPNFDNERVSSVSPLRAGSVAEGVFSMLRETFMGSKCLKNTPKNKPENPGCSTCLVSGAGCHLVDLSPHQLVEQSCPRAKGTAVREPCHPGRVVAG